MIPYDTIVSVDFVDYIADAFKLDEITPKLTEDQLAQLKNNFRQSSKHLFRRGSSFGFMAEDVLAWKFDCLTPTGQSKGYDYIHKVTGVKYELKSFTKTGIALGASKFFGKGRKINLKEFKENARNKEYIVADHLSFQKTGVLRFIQLSDENVIELGPKLGIKKSSELFNR